MSKVAFITGATRGKSRKNAQKAASHLHNLENRLHIEQVT